MLNVSKRLAITLIVVGTMLGITACSTFSATSENGKDAVEVTADNDSANSKDTTSEGAANKGTTSGDPSKEGQNKGSGTKGNKPKAGPAGDVKLEAIDAQLAPVPEDGFSFAIQADSHLDENTSTDLYKETLNNIVSNKDEFVVDLGDTFMTEKFAKEEDQVEERYEEVKSYFDILGDLPLYLVNGNHDGEWGFNMGKADISTMAREARLKYFPSTSELQLQSGNTETANYYTFQRGEAQFIVLDPYTYTTEKTKDDATGWYNTLGKTQYDWLKKILEESEAKYKFVFIHNLVGGSGKDSRGGAEAAKFFEWGGYSADGTYDFDKMRPGWGEPIHQLLVDNNVSAVFHGHDHFYGKQELDGITYQLVPQPGTPGNSVSDRENYSYEEGEFLPSAGYLRVVVSQDKVNVEYVISSTDESLNGKLAATYEIN